MTREEKLEQLLKARVGVRTLMSDINKTILDKEMTPIVESATAYKMKVINYNNAFCDITFNLGDWNREFGLSFTIRLVDKNIELSHGMLNSIPQEKRPYIIERDKIIAKLWDKQEEIQKVFQHIDKEWVSLSNAYTKLDNEIWEIKQEIKKEETKKCLDMLSVGSKWVYTWNKKRPMTIEKITNKMIFFNRRYDCLGDNSTRIKINDWVNYMKNGSIVAYEEEKGESYEQ